MSTIRQPGSAVAGKPADTAVVAKLPAASRLGDLLERSAAGDRAAFADLYAETAPRAFGLALRVMRNRSLAEDVTQEAYLKIWHTAARFDQRQGSCQGWILMIVHRVAIDHVRSTQASSVRDDPHHRASFAKDRVDDNPTNDLAHASLEGVRARSALSRLSVLQREALELAYFEGHTYSAMAELLGVPPGTIKSRIRDGLIRMRESLSAPDGPHGTP